VVLRDSPRRYAIAGVGFTFAWLHRPEVAIDGDNPPGRPLRAFDDGKKVYIANY
jgi:type IV secretory pathway VirB9-like protein